MKFVEKHEDKAGRHLDQRVIAAFAYDNMADRASGDAEIGRIEVYESHGCYRAFDTFDGAYTRWYRDERQVLIAAERYARELAGAGGQVSRDE